MSTVSVIIPTFNSSTFVAQAVESVLAQTRPPAEIIVIDDGSTDDTASRLQVYGARIQYVFQSNRGRSSARNAGLQMAQSDYVAFLDADDVWLPRKLETQLNDLHSHAGAKWAYSQTQLVDEHNSPLRSNFWPEFFGTGKAGAHEVLEALLAGSIEVPTSTIVVDKSSLFQTGLFDESLSTGEDTQLWIRLAQRIGPLLYTPQVLATRRVNACASFLERFVDYGYAETAPRALLSGLDVTSYADNLTPSTRKALCRTYLDSTFIELAHDRMKEALHSWEEAGTWCEPEQFSTAVALRLGDFALSSARYHRDGPLEAERILRVLISRLPRLGWKDSRTNRLALGHLYAAIAYMFETKRQTASMSTYARHALCANPRLVRDLGLCKRAAGLS